MVILLVKWPRLNFSCQLFILIDTILCDPTHFVKESVKMCLTYESNFRAMTSGVNPPMQAEETAQNSAAAGNGQNSGGEPPPTLEDSQAQQQQQQQQQQPQQQQQHDQEHQQGYQTSDYFGANSTANNATSNGSSQNSSSTTNQYSSYGRAMSQYIQVNTIIARRFLILATLIWFVYFEGLLFQSIRRLRWPRIHRWICWNRKWIAVGHGGRTGSLLWDYWKFRHRNQCHFRLLLLQQLHGCCGRVLPPDWVWLFTGILAKKPGNILSP